MSCARRSSHDDDRDAALREPVAPLVDGVLGLVDDLRALVDDADDDHADGDDGQHAEAHQHQQRGHLPRHDSSQQAGHRFEDHAQHDGHDERQDEPEMAEKPV